MKKNFVTFEIARAMKELGFDEECLGRYEQYELVIALSNSVGRKKFIQAPLWQDVIDWFREKHNLHTVITVNPYSEINEVHGYKIYDSSKNMQCVSNQETQSWTHYKAREQAILKSIELVKNQQV